MSEAEAPQTSGRGLGRAGWNLADQILSALTNFAMSFVIARNVSAEEFGQFSVAFLVFSIMIGVQRALISMPLTIVDSRAEGRRRVLVASEAVGAVFWLTLPVSAGLLVLALLHRETDGTSWLALALVLPLLVVQDVCRLAFIAWGKPQLATLNDAIWGVAQFALVVSLLQFEVTTAAWMILAWGVAAGLAAAVGLWQLKARPKARRGLAWMRSNWGVSRYLLMNYLLDVGTFQGGILLFGGYLGVADIGSLRAAQVLTGPLGILAAAAMTFAVPEISRSGMPRRPMLVVWGLSGCLVAVSLLYTAVLLLIPDSLGVQLLGETWTGAESVLLPVAFTSVVSSAKLGPTVLIFGMGHASRTTPLIIALAVSAMLFMFIGAVWFGVTGLAWGMCAAQAVVVPLWFLQARRTVRIGPVDFSGSRT